MSEIKQRPEPVKSPDKLKLLITVVNRVKSEYYADLIQSFGANIQCFVSSKGTAQNEMLDIIGLADDRKSTILSVIREERAQELLDTLAKRFNTIKDGKGIAFTVPMSSVVGVLAYRFLADKRETQRFL
ncbi:MAG: hypothetical protein J6X34_05335 [Clostridia bacterium]|nr:hypothetical protein [Clostridia bacterium]MBP5780640.1 hypothetical protein [Clostridia bacterium]